MSSPERLAALGGKPIRVREFPIEEPIFGNRERKCIERVVDSNRFSIFSSDEIGQFEEEYSGFTGTRFSVGVTSGTAAIHAALCSLDAPVGAEVLVPVYTYAATVNAIYLAGLRPAFVDLCERSPNLSLDDAAARVNERTVAILGVDLFGIPFDRDKAIGLANRHGIVLVEDCAQSAGAEWDGRRVGSFGLGCHSFGEIKNMTTAEGGMVTSSDEQTVNRLRAFRHACEVWTDTGMSTVGPRSAEIDRFLSGFDYVGAGHNYRMNALQAALGRAQLARMPSLNEQRNAIYSTISSALAGVDCVSMFSIPPSAQPVANRCALLIGPHAQLSRRAVLYAFLAEGIPAGVYYPLLHSRTRHAERLRGSDSSQYVNADLVIARHILVPCFPAMSAADAADVAAAARKIFGSALSTADMTAIEDAATRAKVRYFGQFLTFDR